VGHLRNFFSKWVKYIIFFKQGQKKKFYIVSFGQKEKETQIVHAGNPQLQKATNQNQYL